MLKNTDLRNPQVAIIDFGLAHVCAGPGEAGGTPGYIPPETNTRHIWYPKGDIFALGVTFFQLLADKTPQEKLGKFGVFQEGFRTMDDVVLFTATRPLPWHLVAGTYPGVMSWLPGMCSKEKKPRPRALGVLNSPFFSGSEAENGNSAGPNAASVLAQGNANLQKLQAATDNLGRSQLSTRVPVSSPYNAGNAIWTMSLQSSTIPAQASVPVQARSPIIQGQPARVINQPSITAARPAVTRQPQQMQIQGVTAAAGVRSPRPAGVAAAGVLSPRPAGGVQYVQAGQVV